MQIRAIVLYSRTGRRRIVEFEPGSLNIVTGFSATGKSALLDIVEYCLGRNTLVMPVGPITETVGWYGLLLAHGTTQVFIGRPAPGEGATTTQQAMVEIGADLDIPEHDELTVNADTRSLRDQVGRLIGIDENAGDPSTPWASSGLEANLGHAALLCLQRQSEIADRDFLFHRQGEEGLSGAIRDTLPYFLGAVPADQAVQRQMLTTARRDLRRAMADLERAKAADEDIDVSLLAMVREAAGAGLLPSAEILGRAEMFDALNSALQHTPPPEQTDDMTASRLRALARERDELRAALRTAGDQAALLRSIDSDESDFTGAVEQQLSRLTVLDLLDQNEDFNGDANEAAPGSCPACGQGLPHPDPTIDEMRAVAVELRAQLEDVEAIRPRRGEALSRLTADIDALREKLRATEHAIAALDVNADRTGAAAETQAFTRGRIQQFLETARPSQTGSIPRLADLVRVREQAVQAILDRLDPDAMREELNARLSVIATDMTAYARRLQLEYADAVWLDANRLTVMADTAQGAMPLFRVGSAANWIGYHLAVHLALHRYLVRHDRPVPHFLMLDQPTQAYYPSDVEQERGLPGSEDDREAVSRMFELMRDVCEELAPGLQIIVCDHANLPDDWFQASVRQNWRGGEKLIPQEWIDEHS